MERLIEEWCDLDHIICAAVNQWRSRLGACVRAVEVTLNINLTATATVIYRFN